MTSYVLAIDQGTTSTRASLFRADTSVAAFAQQEFPQHFPADGEVEHEPEDLWTTTVACCRGAMQKAGASARDIVAIGITNQRETTLLWDRATGRAVHRAIVWQDRRTADICARLKAAGHEAEFAGRPGCCSIRIFPAQNSPGCWIARRTFASWPRAANSRSAPSIRICLWRLTGGKVHATDATNASRTLLFDIHEGRWDDRLLALLGVPKADFAGGAGLLRRVRRDRSGTVRRRDPDLRHRRRPAGGARSARPVSRRAWSRPLTAPAVSPCSIPARRRSPPQNKLLTTIAYQLGGVRAYALEGSIFIAGAAVQWLRDSLHVVQSAAETDALAAAADPTQEVVLVPAFVGLGAPYWRPDARGALFGLTRATGPRELAQAALESVCFQTVDLLDAMRADWRDGASALKTLRVDGGMANSDWTMQRLADLVGCIVDRPQIRETTALGAAYLAGLRAGFFPEPDRFAEHWQLQRRFTPQMDTALRERKLAAWKAAVARLL